MNVLFILASLAAVVVVLGGAIVSDNCVNDNGVVNENVIFCRTIPTHHVVTVYIVVSEETQVHQDHRYVTKDKTVLQ